jgi:hypothetical protein
MSVAGKEIDLKEKYASRHFRGSGRGRNYIRSDSRAHHLKRQTLNPRKWKCTDVPRLWQRLQAQQKPPASRYLVIYEKTQTPSNAFNNCIVWAQISTTKVHNQTVFNFNSAYSSSDRIAENVVHPHIDSLPNRGFIICVQCFLLSCRRNCPGRWRR